jgi:(p)ppGpp synthase/HD superfamily hydrolase
MENWTLADVLAFATEAHKGQKRKYTGEDYIVHPISVSALVKKHGGSEIQQAGALLHDVVEDTQYTLADINANFGSQVATLVKWLTDTSRPEDGNRKTRKEIDRNRLGNAPADVQMIKLADMIDNSTTIFTLDKNFAPVFKREMGELVAAMTKVEGSSLWKEAQKRITHV